MKKQTILITISILVIIACCTVLINKYQSGSDDIITFATSAEYPPFEYFKDGEMVGFDIDIALLIAKELKKEAKFVNMPFNGILPVLSSNRADAAIATITITPERQKNFDFSNPYYKEKIAIIYPKDSPIKNGLDIQDKIIACQLGTTMELWLKQNIQAQNIVPLDSNNIAIESLKAGHVQGVLIDIAQANAFSQNNKGLAFSVLEKSNSGYGIAFKKDSKLIEQINAILKKLETNGTLKSLEKKWIEVEHV